MYNFSWRAKYFSIALIFLIPQVSTAEQTLLQYAAQCDQEIGISVPSFDCDEGTLVPGQLHADPLKNNYDHTGPCDNPGFFHRGSLCTPGTRFKVLEDNGDALIVGICRKNTLPVNGPHYGDVAIIQTSRFTGATCFYQRDGYTSSNVPAPSNPNDDGDWKKPKGTITICRDCHDAVPIIRSPALTAIKSGPDQLPPNLNRANDPYWWVGEYAKNSHLQPVSITSEGNQCLNCHRYGASIRWSRDYFYENVQYLIEGGGFQTFARLGTLPLNYQSDYQAIDPNATKWWMVPGSTDWWPSFSSMLELESCKDSFEYLNHGQYITNSIDYPSSPGCTIKPTHKVSRIQPTKDYKISNKANSSKKLALASSGSPYVTTSTTVSNWRLYTDGQNWFRLRNSTSGKYACVNSSGSLTGCSSSQLTTYKHKWELVPYNDYVSNGGQPSGLTFTIRSLDYPTQYLYLNSSSLAFGSTNTASPNAVWTVNPQ